MRKDCNYVLRPLVCLRKQSTAFWQLYAFTPMNFTCSDYAPSTMSSKHAIPNHAGPRSPHAKQPLISRAKVPQAIGQYSKGKAITNMPGISVAAKMLHVSCLTCLTLLGHGSNHWSIRFLVNPLFIPPGTVLCGTIFFTFKAARSNAGDKAIAAGTMAYSIQSSVV